MKFLFLTTYDRGGAAIAALRMHQALLEKGHQSIVLVKEKTKKDDTILSLNQIIPGSRFSSYLSLIKNRIKQLFKKKEVTKNEYCFYGLDDRFYTVDFTNHYRKLPFIPDVIVPCWTSNFLNAQSIAILQQMTGARVFWWGLDMSPLTGGCHYAWDCEGYTRDCSWCPAVEVIRYKNIPAKNLQSKKDSVVQTGMNFIAGSTSLVMQARQSALFSSQEEIPKVLMCIDEKVFNARNRETARKEMGFLTDQKVVFFGSTFTKEKRKGIKYFIEALQQLKHIIEQSSSTNLSQKILVVVVGNQLSEMEYLQLIPFDVKTLDFISNEMDLSRIYKSSNVFVSSSLEDSGPMMINESVMCGTPVVSFNIGVADDLVLPGISGYKAELLDTDSLAQGIFNILSLTQFDYDNLVKTTANLAMERTSKNVVVEQFLKIVNR